MIWAVVPGDPVDHQVDLFSIGSQESPSFPFPFHLTGLSAGTIPDPSNAETTTRRFEQTVDDRETVFTIQVPDILYEYYQSRIRTLDWGGYVSDRYDNQYIKSITNEIEQFGDRHGYSDRQIVHHAVSFVQQLEYTQDKPATGYNEYPKHPVETLVDRGGDCEDSCILLSALLREPGYDTVLLVIRDASHMALGVAGDDSLEGSYYESNGTKYFYLETTSGGWEVGQVPESVRNSDGQAESHEVNSRPVLVHKWVVQPRTEGGVTVEVGVRNVGDAATKTAEVEFEFETQSGETVASKRTALPNVDVDEYKKTTLNLVPSDGTTLRGRARLYLDGELHDKSTSDFEEPIEPGNA